MNEPKKRKPAKLADFLPTVLRQQGIAARIAQAGVVEVWPELVGPTIGKVTRAISVTPDGVLFVGVHTNGWMQELTMMMPEIISSVNTRAGTAIIRRIQFRLLGPDER